MSAAGRSSKAVQGPQRPPKVAGRVRSGASSPPHASPDVLSLAARVGDVSSGVERSAPRCRAVMRSCEPPRRAAGARPKHNTRNSVRTRNVFFSRPSVGFVRRAAACKVWPWPLVREMLRARPGAAHRRRVARADRPFLGHPARWPKVRGRSRRPFTATLPRCRRLANGARLDPRPPTPHDLDEALS